MLYDKRCLCRRVLLVYSRPGVVIRHLAGGNELVHGRDSDTPAGTLRRCGRGLNGTELKPIESGIEARFGISDDKFISALL